MVVKLATRPRAAADSPSRRNPRQKPNPNLSRPSPCDAGQRAASPFAAAAGSREIVGAEGGGRSSVLVAAGLRDVDGGTARRFNAGRKGRGSDTPSGAACQRRWTANSVNLRRFIRANLEQRDIDEILF